MSLQIETPWGNFAYRVFSINIGIKRVRGVYCKEIYVKLSEMKILVITFLNCMGGGTAPTP